LKKLRNLNMLTLLFATLGCSWEGELPFPGLMWGPAGHGVIARIANQLVTPEVRNAARSVLGGKEIYQVASWADSFDHTSPGHWSFSLHFVDIQARPACSVDYERDCPHDWCVIGAVKNYTRRLTNVTSPDGESDMDLKFLVHYFGDIHQPLHVSEADDRGGNTEHGTFFGKKTALHKLWDTGLIEHRLHSDWRNSRKAFGVDEAGYADHLREQITAEERTEWLTCPSDEAWPCSLHWAQHTASLACHHAHLDTSGKRIGRNFVLGAAYYNANIGIVEDQLKRAGVRLAEGLMRLFGKSHLEGPGWVEEPLRGVQRGVKHTRD